MSKAIDRISVVIPVYNSGDCLAALLKELASVLDYFSSSEIILVNDGSTDNSWEVLAKENKNYSNLVCVNLRKNFGQDNALLAGLRLATGNYVVIMDDDLQHAPKDIIPLYEQCKKGFDVCYADFESQEQSWWKRFGSRMNGKLAERLLKKPKHIYLSPYKIIARGVVDEIIKFSGPFPYIDATILTITDKFTQIPAVHQKRFAGKSNYNLSRSAKVFMKHATNYSVYPLRLVTMTGFTIAFLSFASGIFYLCQYFFSDHKVEGWISLMLGLIFFGGILMASIGLIGEYIGRIFLSVNSKPQYTIQSILKNERSK